MIDILIPLYNNEKYIEQCIKSIKEQDADNFNVYIINDGSTDTSLQKALDAINKDERFTIISRDNKGVSITRQELIELSTSDYITFIDSDDYLYGKDALRKMIETRKKENSDIVICNILKKINNKLINNRCLDEEIKTIDNIKALENLLYIKHDGATFCGALFKKELFNNIKFKPDVLYEDMDVIYKIIDKAKRITYYNTPVYVYRIKKENSIMRSSFSEKNMNLINISKNIISYIKENHPELEDAAIYTFNNNCLELLRLKVLTKKGFDDKGKLIEEIRKNKSNIINDINSSKGKIIQTKIAAKGEFYFKILMFAYVKLLHKY